MRLIDKDSLLRHFQHSSADTPEKVMLLIEAEKAVDAVPVVRCKDCRYAREPKRNCREESVAFEGTLICTVGPDVVYRDETGLKFVDEDFFCADGERKGGDTE